MSAHLDSHGAVLVGVDGSADARDAVTWAAREADRRDSTLRILHASPWSLLAEEPRVRNQAWNDVELGHRARRILAEAAAHAHDVVPHLTLDTELVCGDGPVELARAGSGACLVVVGRRGLGTEGGPLVGSAAAVLAEQMSMPVVVCGQRAKHSQLGGHDGPVVVGIDTPARADCSRHQHTVIEHAFALAQRTTGALRAVHAWSDADWGPAEPVAAYLQDWPTAAKDAEVALVDLLTGWHDRYPDVTTMVRVVDSRPANALIEASTDASVVVVGGCGRASLRGSRFGPVARRVTAGASSPVVVVPDLAT